MKYFYYFIIFILIFFIGSVFFKKPTSTGVFLNNNYKDINRILQNYLERINVDEIGFKTNYKINKYSSINQIVKFYKNNILEFSNHEKDLVNKHISFINSRTGDLPVLSKSNWKFMKLSPNIEQQMPFTLDDIIFLPVQMLKSMENDARFIDNCDTLIHEKIHVIQRKYKKVFNQFYKKYLGAKYVKHLIITDKWKKLNLKNPDGLDVNWIYKFKGKYYLPMLTFDDEYGLEQRIIALKKVGKEYITTNHSKNAYDIFPDYPKFISVYHPNEITAYSIPKIILSNKKLTTNLELITRKLINNYLKNISII